MAIKTFIGIFLIVLAITVSRNFSPTSKPLLTVDKCYDGIAYIKTPYGITVKYIIQGGYPTVATCK